MSTVQEFNRFSKSALLRPNDSHIEVRRNVRGRCPQRGVEQIRSLIQLDLAYIGRAEIVARGRKARIDAQSFFVIMNGLVKPARPVANESEQIVSLRILRTEANGAA